MHFIYLGEAILNEERRNEFMDVARSLEIRELSRESSRETSREVAEERELQRGIQSEPCPGGACLSNGPYLVSPQ